MWCFASVRGLIGEVLFLDSPKSSLIGNINCITCDTFKKLMESCIFALKVAKERKERKEIEVNECRLMIVRVLVNFLNFRIYCINYSF